MFAWCTCVHLRDARVFVGCTYVHLKIIRLLNGAVTITTKPWRAPKVF